MNVWTKIPALKKLKANSKNNPWMYTHTHTYIARQNENYPIREEYTSMKTH